MKKIFLMAIIAIFSLAAANAQVVTAEGMCGEDVAWTFDGHTLTLYNVSKKGAMVEMKNYDTKTPTPWAKKALNIRRIRVGKGISRLGSCAFYNCKDLTDVEFLSTDVKEIGWGTFLNCTHLRNISLPVGLKKIETVAFANCYSLSTISIPDQCRVEDQAFVSCTGLSQISVASTSILGHYVFATEVNTEEGIRHALSLAEIKKLPAYVNSNNSHEYGLAKETVSKYLGNYSGSNIDYDEITSVVDTIIPSSASTRNNTYALVIGNQNYRFVSDVPYAIHDARVFSEYCKNTLGIPSENIHVCEDATKQMILEEEFEWLDNIKDRENKKIIVYYAGHGVPDVKNSNKAYMLPTDVRGTKPSHGIALDDFYARLGSLAFNQCSVFLDACFSGVNRDNEGVDEGLRGVEIDATEGAIGEGNVVVFSAAQGNETAQGYTEQGHGLFTYYLLKDLQDSYGYITFGELSDHLKSNVSRTAVTLKMRKPQTPSTNASEQLGDSWRALRF